ncbi:hypothetical protein AJ85_06205 [Alkalihalobacillus alcalophilus ATCC 27647 = CGMCC 1.3604]|uniref:DUF3941 domain-containing protein n=1 Tax=Alkalihalobacillus alcalophilus ATCC 27647 = CGMCC 1.3604 TaxID=1218173 RepID=A0A4S4JVV6_ALKAL|nr:DUF3941 domain-containing protein [Alkalihalobacillus alcalophilus]MED1562095.1 DUF3941 domain-containing protein [Alkalihalobacillus alcalophilus]THG88367.1 hypothetical protein AJ85_06205 [Alkalihalobacillus alcalophilus ATCC 27647 = CGMCC 1.3604]
MSHTGDPNKKAKDNNAKNKVKNQEEKINAQHGKHDYSKKTDHL